MAFLVLAFLVGACAAVAPAGEQVPLLTGVGETCYAGGEQGVTATLVAEPSYGTTFSGRAVMWPIGYTARRVGSEVVVIDTKGNVKATTGRTYHISYAPLPDIHDVDGSLKDGIPGNPFPAAADCGYPWDFVDCGPAGALNVPPKEYC